MQVLRARVCVWAGAPRFRVFQTKEARHFIVVWSCVYSEKIRLFPAVLEPIVSLARRENEWRVKRRDCNNDGVVGRGHTALA
jgi:hypothetical protein